MNIHQPQLCVHRSVGQLALPLLHPSALGSRPVQNPFGSRKLSHGADSRGHGPHYSLLIPSAVRTEPQEPPAKRLPVRADPSAVPEAHKVFDEVVITVKSGRGGNGEVVPSGRGRWVENFKYTPGGNSRKKIWLPASEPGDGADGGDVVLVCDPGVDSLLHLHAGPSGASGKQGKAGGGKAGNSKGGGGGSGSKKAGGGGKGGGAAGAAVFCAPDGSNANPNTGSSGPKRNAEIKKARTPCLEIPVPPGTVVKRKGTGALVGELLQPGERLTVVRGGAGGHGVVAPSRQQRLERLSRAEREARNKGVEVVAVEDDEWLADSRGQPGQQLGLSLLLRVVADVGLVGFPNAGKSSLLKALTRASPTIAPYPFTTLMPNLGVLSAGGGATKAVLADLPGLIEGAHKGRGLGRNFLRHLRRTRALLHVVDASAPDPATDYYAVREELRMYNPDYCARPHVVALNKTDLLMGPATQVPAQQEGPEPEASGHPQRQQQRQQPGSEHVSALVAALQEAARRQAAEHSEHGYEGPAPKAPLAVVPCSAATGDGLKELAAALQRAIGASYIAEPDIVRPAPDTLAAARGAPSTPAPTASDSDSAAVGAAAAAAATAAAAAAPSAASRTRSPPALPPGWDDDAGAADDNDGWGASPSSAGFDDVAAELDPAELERFYARLRETGLVDAEGNFTGAEAPGHAEEEEERVMQPHSAPAGQEQTFLDALEGGGADGDGDDDEWVDLSTLDEETLAAVLAELAAAEGDGEGESEGGERLIDPDRDIMLAPEEEEEDVVGETEGQTEEGGEEAGRGGEEEEEVGEDGAPLVRMACQDDPDAALLALSTEELLAMEEW